MKWLHLLFCVCFWFLGCCILFQDSPLGCCICWLWWFCKLLRLCLHKSAAVLSALIAQVAFQIAVVRGSSSECVYAVCCLFCFGDTTLSLVCRLCVYVLLPDGAVWVLLLCSGVLLQVLLAISGILVLRIMQASSWFSLLLHDGLE